MVERMPVLFVGHGAAVFTTAASDPTHRWMQAFAATIRGWAPRAVVVVSAHDVGTSVRVGAHPRPATIHDHPATAAYGLRYPVAGDPELAHQIVERLERSGIAAGLDPEHGLDHGAWIPLSLLLPAADVPVVPVSLLQPGSPADHVGLGAALAPLRGLGVLLVASGGITHDQHEFRRGYLDGLPVDREVPFSQRFEAWVSSAVLDPSHRAERLLEFDRHPDAARAHPTIDHLLPLFVAIGAAGRDRGQQLHAGFQHGLSTSAFAFGSVD